MLSDEQEEICRAVLGMRTGTGLESFVCTPTEVMTFVDILAKCTSIRYLRANVQMLKEEDQPTLLQVRGLRSLALDFASPKLIAALPTWAAGTLGLSLKNLTFYVSNGFPSSKSELKSRVQSCFGLTADALRTTVTQLPNLTGLHISTCKGFDFVDVFRVIAHAPSLITLSFSIWVGIHPSELCAPSFDTDPDVLQDLTRALQGNLRPFHLPNLKELVVDLLGTPNPFPLKSFLSVFVLFAGAPLASLAICGRSQTIPCLPLESYDLLVNQHADTLRRVVLVKAQIPVPALSSICKECKQLEILGVAVPSADLVRRVQSS